MQRDKDRVPRYGAGRARFPFAFFLTLLAAAFAVVAPGCGTSSHEQGELTGKTSQALTATYQWSGFYYSGFTGCIYGGFGDAGLCTSPEQACQSASINFFNGPYYVSGGVTSGVDTPICNYYYSPWSAWLTFEITTSACPSGQTDDYNTPWACAPSGTGGSQPDKALGGASPGDVDQASDTSSNGPTSTGSMTAGEPIDIGSGNVFYRHTDYKTAGPNKLAFMRFYNSRGFSGSALGPHWRSNYDRYIYFDTTTAVVERADGQKLKFTLSGSTWSTDSDVDYTLTHSGTTWTFTSPDDTVETYTTNGAGTGATLNTIVLRNGYTQTMGYTSGQLTTVTDSYSRVLTLTYNGTGTLATMSTPDSNTFTYGYNGDNTLSSVASPVDSGYSTYSYTYDTSNIATDLIAVYDRYGEQLNGWTYDAYGRGLTSFQGGSGINANLTTLTYNDSTGARTVTNALGVTDTYTFSTLQGVQKVTGISRASTATTAAATETLAYDSNGFLDSFTDWNSNVTTYTNNSHGLPTSITEAYGAGVARTTTIAYDSTFVHLPDSITTPGVTTSFTYDGSGDVLTRTLTDTTSTSTPYSTNGQTRTWTYTWSSYLPATAKTPRNYTTTFGYTSGALTSITDALSNVTSVTSYTGGGYPQTVVDPNGVSTALSYDGEMRLTAKAVSTGGGTLTTSYAYWFANLVNTLTLPDSSQWTSTPDAAQRIASFTNTYGDNIQYTLDAMGGRTAENTYDPSSTLYRQHAATFDALERKLTDVGGASQTTTFTYDPDGNALTVEDGRSHTTTRTFDALNRLSTSTDANSGVVTYTYDAHDRITNIQDALSHSTSYVYDGFGDVIQQTSPDTGTTVYTYDADGNLTQKVDAASVTVNQTFDALDRTLTTTYPADSSLNVAYTYDQTGAGYTFGIGRLTSLTDAAGSLARQYDELGHLTQEKRTHGGTVLTTSYTYDAAGREASITYPSGAVSTMIRDAVGRVINMPFSATGSDEAYSLWGAGYIPFGPPSYITFNNGDQGVYGYDLDYRLTSLVYNDWTSTPYFSWSYGYDGANNVTGITDAITSANSQTFGYDVINRLTSQTSTNYGNVSWTLDKNGNVTAGAGCTFGLSSGTNRLASITGCGTSVSYSTTSTGNISDVVAGGFHQVNSYSKANRLASISGITPSVTATVYDAFGRRFSKTTGTPTTTLFTYDQDGNLLEESTGGVVTDYVYLANLNIANWQPSDGHLYMINGDLEGTPQVSRDEYGLTNWAARTDAYGATTVTTSTGAFTGPVTQGLRLPGQYYDTEAGNNYNGARDMIPGFIGRYMEADPSGLAGGMNPYVYANNNPGRFTDPTGLNADDSSAVCTFADPTGGDLAMKIVDVGRNPEFYLLLLQAAIAGATDGVSAAVASGARYGLRDLLSDESGSLPGPSGPTLDQGQQDKHIPGTNNYDPKDNRSILTHSDPQGLLDTYAGTGQSANGVPVGQPGSRERVDFQQPIGQYIDQATGNSRPTTVGLIHYNGSNGAHIVPARPK